jgi:ubiquinone/menaquinone biosynthesis C-methylase UbiE
MGGKKFPGRFKVTRGRQAVVEEFFDKAKKGSVSVDIAGAASPVILARKLRKNESHLIIDPLKGLYDFSGLDRAKKIPGVVHIDHEVTPETKLPLRSESVDRIDCRQAYDKGKILDQEHLASEARRVLKSGGVIVVSCKTKDLDKMRDAFYSKGFVPEKAEKPTTKFEKSPAKIAEEMRKENEKNRILMEQMNISQDTIAKRMKEKEERANAIRTNVHVMKFRKA